MGLIRRFWLQSKLRLAVYVLGIAAITLLAATAPSLSHGSMQPVQMPLAKAGAAADNLSKTAATGATTADVNLPASGAANPVAATASQYPAQGTVSNLAAPSVASQPANLDQPPPATTAVPPANNRPADMCRPLGGPEPDVTISHCSVCGWRPGMMCPMAAQ